MFVVRAVFWLTLVAMLVPEVPHDDARPPGGGPQERVGLLDTVMAGKAAVADLAGFCDRNPDACRTAGIAARELTDGVIRLVEKLIGGPEAPVPPQPPAAPGRDTLTPTDREPAWRGPQ